MTAKEKITEILALADIRVNGDRPWDIQINDPIVYKMILGRGSLGLGEAYMYGYWDCEDLPEFISKVLQANIAEKVSLDFNTFFLILKSKLFNRQNKAQTMAMGRLHYDVPHEVWEATLDSSMTGSCGYYPTGEESLDEGQEIKKKMTIEKLHISPGQTLLDIGVGWASFSGYAYEHYGARPIGVTVSNGQREYIRSKYGDAIDVRVHDYRDLQLDEPVDRILSVEMFEHVGSDNYRTFFELCRNNIKDDGLMLLHTIVDDTRHKNIDPWMDKYIYPGGCLPTPGQIATAIEGLFHLEDVHDIGAHYHRTLTQWIDKFRSHRDEIKALGKEKLGMEPEAFCRMWDYHYLVSAGGFSSRSISVHQYVLSPNGIAGGFRYNRP